MKFQPKRSDEVLQADSPPGCSLCCILTLTSIKEQKKKGVPIYFLWTCYNHAQLNTSCECFHSLKLLRKSPLALGVGGTHALLSQPLMRSAATLSKVTDLRGREARAAFNPPLHLSEMERFFFLFFFCIISLLCFSCLRTFPFSDSSFGTRPLSTSSSLCRTLPPVESLSGCSRFTQLRRSPPAAVPSLFLPHSFYFATHTRAVLLNYITVRAVRQKKREEEEEKKRETAASLGEGKQDSG